MSYSFADTTYNHTTRAEGCRFLSWMVPAAVAVLVFIFVPSNAHADLIIAILATILNVGVAFAILWLSTPFWNAPWTTWSHISVMAVWLILGWGVQWEPNSVFFISGTSATLALVLYVLETRPFYRRSVMSQPGEPIQFALYRHNGWLGQLLGRDVQSQRRRKSRQEIKQ